MSEMKGPARQLLDTYLQGTHATVGRIADASSDWKQSAGLLDTIATSLSQQIPMLPTAFGEDSAVAAAAAKAFGQAATDLRDRARKLREGSTQLGAVHDQIVASQNVQQKLAPPGDPGTAPTVTDWNDKGQKKKYDAWKTRSDAAGKAYQDNETAAQAQITALDNAFGDATATMQEIHGEAPASPPSAGGGDGGAGGAGGAGGGTPAVTGGGRHPATHSAGAWPGQPTGPSHPVHGSTTGATSGTPTGTTGGPVTTTGQPVGGGLLQGATGPVPTMPTTASAATTQLPSTQGAGGGIGGGAGAGVLGAGAVGGVGAYGAGAYGAGGGVAGAAGQLRFAPGQAIGGAGAGRLSGGVLGAEEETAAGRRTGTVVGAGGSGTRTGGAGGRGASGGRAGTRAGTRAGGTAAGRGGRGRGRGRERGEQGAEDLWDDGSDWVDDEGAGPAVMR